MQLGHGAGPVKPQMWVTSVIRPHEGPTSGNVEGLWWQPAPTWREECINEIYGKNHLRRQVEASGVAAKGEPFMPPSIGDPSLDIQATRGSERHYCLHNLERFALLWSEEPVPLQESALRHMVEMVLNSV